jgi:hypothetical protein
MNGRIKDHARNEEMNAKNKVEWCGVGVTAVGTPDGPLCLYIEGQDEVIIVSNFPAFKEKIRRVLERFPEAAQPQKLEQPDKIFIPVAEKK